MDLSLLTKENVLFGTRLGAMALSGLWYGASQYITSVECPARINLPSGSVMVDNFQQTFPRAMKFQATLAKVLVIHGVVQYFADMASPGAKFFLGAGMSFASLIPWTLIMIMPINHQLMDGEVPKKKGDEWIKELMNGWDRVHLVRTMLGALGFGLSIAGILVSK